MDTLDADNMKDKFINKIQGISRFINKIRIITSHPYKLGCYLVMDNALIHTSTDIRKMIEDCGYKCVYLPPYSPFLNPIEEFWSKVKAGVRRDGLTKDDNLSSRITESSLTVTPEHCQG